MQVSYANLTTNLSQFDQQKTKSLIDNTYGNKITEETNKKTHHDYVETSSKKNNGRRESINPRHYEAKNTRGEKVGKATNSS